MDFPQLQEVKAIEKYKLFLAYSDGTSGYLDLSHVAGVGVFNYWETGDNFFKVYVNPILHGITWSDELDICPDAAYLTLKGITFEEWKAQNSSHAAA
ncbi:MAG: DUF2442 domain-containing protein [Bacteroidota bacterium]|nr:DUF2442 domain-containing protein [Bacteroidota bacterium]